MSRYTNSEKLLGQAKKTIPLGAQTFSKSYTQFPFGVSPYFAESAEGCRITDVDGNEYVDFINSLAAITLGYNDKDVIAAVSKQLQNGTIFSLSHRLESEVAEKLVSMIPCAEKVRFGKNGSDATAGAVRAARAFTGRDMVVVCGYHGWQDWYIGSTPRNLGVPEDVQRLTLKFTYNDLDSLEELFKQYPEEISAVVMEPMNVAWPADGFLEGVKGMAHKYGALLVFDEVVTGFRFSNGGAQEYFGVTPDLATIGKGMANGYPISAVVGRGDVMAVMEEVFFSFTFGGELLSLAAASAVLDKLKNDPVIETIIARGEQLIEGLSQLIKKHHLEDIFSVEGHPSWTFLTISGLSEENMWSLKSLLLQELHELGVLTLGTHNLSYSHQSEDIEFLLGAYNKCFPVIYRAIQSGNIDDALRCKPLQPLFKVR